MSNKLFFMDAFALRQFNDPNYTGTRVNFDPQAFEDRINAITDPKLVDGYASFCKHVMVPNFVKGLQCGYAPITPENASSIKTAYESRNQRELPVLIRYLDRSQHPPPEATWLDVILYSREQIIAECKAIGQTPPESDRPWGIISVKGQLVDYELPMEPITVFRNALGKEEGGSGVALDREKYLESVKFWRDHVAIK
jgi:hypothetical protein